jgi:hypothetical protein
MPDAPTDVDSQPGATPTANADTPEPAESEVVTVENGRRRGRRRVMKKKKVKDEDGYLGRHMCAHLYSHADHVQSPRKKLYGSLSRRTNLHPRGLNLRLPGRQAVRRASRLVRKDKAVLPVSSRKLDTSKMSTYVQYPPSAQARTIIHFPSEHCIPSSHCSFRERKMGLVSTVGAVVKSRSGMQHSHHRRH